MRCFLLLLLCGLASAARFRGGITVSAPVVTPPTPREETCRFCYRACPVSCFVGTCGMDYGTAVKRYKFTNQCWSCDASVSVGISKVGDFSLCSADEAAATTTYLKKREVFDMGPALPGDARKAAQAASDAANAAMKSAQEAAQQADKAAMAALAKSQAVAKAAGKSDEEIMEAHRIAEQIRAQEAAKAAEAAEMARKIAEQKYNEELEKLRREQLLTDRAEEIMQRAEKASEDARAAATKASARAAQAARDAAMSGAAAAGRAAEQAEADELASAARAAQRRAIIAAKSAKDAADKANIAANIAKIPPQPQPTLPPCAMMLLQTGQSKNPSDPNTVQGRQLDCQMPGLEHGDDPQMQGQPLSNTAAAAITGIEVKDPSASAAQAQLSGLPQDQIAAALPQDLSAPPQAVPPLDFGPPSAGGAAPPQSAAAQAVDAAANAVPNAGAIGEEQSVPVPMSMPGGPSIPDEEGGPAQPDLPVPGMPGVTDDQVEEGAVDRIAGGMADTLAGRLEANPGGATQTSTFDVNAAVPNVNQQLMAAMPTGLQAAAGGGGAQGYGDMANKLTLNPSEIPTPQDVMTESGFTGFAGGPQGSMMLQTSKKALKPENHDDRLQKLRKSLQGAGAEGFGIPPLEIE